MIKLIASKIVYLFLMLIAISIISFIAIHLSPNSFFDSGGLNPNITQESISRLKEIYGLDKPLYVQFINWFIAILYLDFGISFSSGMDVSKEILSRIGITIVLNIITLLLVFFVSFYIGIYSALKGGIVDKIVKNISLISYSLPSFYLALILIVLFGYILPIFPIAGTSSGGLSGVAYYLDIGWHLILPIFVMFFGGFGSLSIYVRGLVSDILKSDYIYFAKSRGIDEKNIIKYYILPNLKPPIITILGLSLPSIIGGSVILESIFGIDGMGLLFFNSALSHDYPVIMGILIIGAFLTLLGNIIADLILLKINPFIRLD
jgi:peptide/nickel transport system permease protein